MNNMNLMQIFSRFGNFMQNPAQMLQQMGLTPEAMSNPRATVQQLMNTGRMNQNQFNQLQQMANMMQNNPMFAQMFGKK